MRFYHYFNLLSLDVALGAVVSAAFFARLLGAAVLPQGYFLLGIVVWLIYTTDHLLDAYSMREAATSIRHRFHQQHFSAILPIFSVVSIIAVVLVFMIRIQLITAGIFFGAFVIIYLLISRWLTYFKELAGSALYTGGVLLPAWSLHTQAVNMQQATIIAAFALIVFTNMIVFARFGIEEDILNKQKSLATIMGIRSMNTLIRVVCIACLAVIGYGMVRYRGIEWAVLLMMECMLLAIFLFRYFRHHDRYRIYGDAIFLLPAIIIGPLPVATWLFLP